MDARLREREYRIEVNKLWCRDIERNREKVASDVDKWQNWEKKLVSEPLLPTSNTLPKQLAEFYECNSNKVSKLHLQSQENVNSLIPTNQNCAKANIWLNCRMATLLWLLVSPACEGFNFFFFYEWSVTRRWIFFYFISFYLISLFNTKGLASTFWALIGVINIFSCYRTPSTFNINYKYTSVLKVAIQVLYRFYYANR